MMLGFGMGFGLVGLLLMGLFWAGLIAVAVWVVRSVFPSGQHGPTPPVETGENARDILDRRYARGEITREQYDLMKHEIR
jgi:putative membrane protein